MFNKVLDETAGPFSNFNGRTVKVLEWIGDFNTHFIMDVIF